MNCPKCEHDAAYHNYRGCHYPGCECNHPMNDKPAPEPSPALISKAPALFAICERLMNTGLISTDGYTTDGRPSNCTCHLSPELDSILADAAALVNEIREQDDHAYERDTRDAQYWRTNQTELFAELSAHDRNCRCPNCEGEPDESDLPGFPTTDMLQQISE